MDRFAMTSVSRLDRVGYYIHNKYTLYMYICTMSRTLPRVHTWANAHFDTSPVIESECEGK